ncbi:MAG: hypothetical protein ACFE8U_02905 [Candidatus Hermodarchaeota archaeon]
MVRLKAVYLITDDGFTIYSQLFGATEQDQDMVAALIMALTTFAKEIMSETSLSAVDFGADTDMILEQGERVRAIAIVAFDKDSKERDEYNLRKQLYQFVNYIEKVYAEELTDPIFRKGAFSGVGTLISAEFFRDKMSRIYHQRFASLNEYLKYPTTLLFEITPRGEKLYSFYREFPKFSELMENISIEDFDQLVNNMQEKNSMVSFQDCLDRFGEEKGGTILSLFKYLTKKGMFDAYNFERIAMGPV